jgi:ferredoxin--NADP+ reductase
MLTEKVISVTHYSDRLFSFKTTRNLGFRFKNGEFAMIGLPSLEEGGRDIFRAYSIVSTNFDDHLEFLSIKIEDGPLTSRLCNIKAGDDILLKTKCTGSLVTDYLKPTKNLVMLATGTGIAPFMSISRDLLNTYERFENVYLFHTVRNKNELAYRPELALLETDMPFQYIESVTREPYPREGRFWDHIDGILEGGLTLGRDSVMVCGSTDLNKQCRAMFTEQGWVEGNLGENGDFMLERAFVD